MKSSASALSMGQPPAPRKRKVKTGCITCRIRKVKCDEEHPSCKRCRDTGRTCDGYATPPVREAPRQTMKVARSLQRAPEPRVSWVFADTVISSVLETAEERRFLDFFHRHTGRALSGAFDTGFWTHLLPQLSHSERAIRHALLAVGSLHAKYESSRTLSEKDAIISHQFTLQQYNQSITFLKQPLSSGEEQIEVTLMCCVLFICLECLRGSSKLALSHLQNGLNILNSVTTKDDVRVAKSNNATFGPAFVQKNLRNIFSRLDSQLMLFGKPVSAIEQATLPVIPHTFNDIFEARISMDTLVTISLSFVKYILEMKYRINLSPAVQLRHLALLSRFQPWQHAFEALMKNPRVQHTLNDQREALLLRVHHKSTLIWLATCMSIDESAFDAYTDDFESIVQSAWVLAKLPNNTFLFALDMGIIAPLFLTATKCRSLRIRQSAIKLLHEIPGREGLWDAKLHAQCAERVVAIEEAAGMGPDGWPVPEGRVCNVAILPEGESDAKRYFATFYVLREDGEPGFRFWTEEPIQGLWITCA